MNKKRAVILCFAATLCMAVIVGVVLYMTSKDKVWDLNENTPKEYRMNQNYFMTSGTLVKCEKGYYVNVADEKLDFSRVYFWDGQSDTYSLICTKANCKHNSMDCAACLPGGMLYSNGYFFYTYVDEDLNRYLYRCDENGTHRTEIMLLNDYQNEGDYSSAVIVNGNHIFVQKQSLDENLDSYILDYNMERIGKDDYCTEVFRTEHQANLEISVEGMNDTNMLYYWYNKEDDRTYLYEYSSETKQSRLITTVEGTNNKNTVLTLEYAENNILYTCKSGCYMLPDGNEDNKIKITDNKRNASYVSFDGRYIYVSHTNPTRDKDDVDFVEVYDMEGKFIRKIDMPDSTGDRFKSWCNFGDESRLFATCFSGGPVYVLDKNDENAVWRRIDKE